MTAIYICFCKFVLQTPYICKKFYPYKLFFPEVQCPSPPTALHGSQSGVGRRFGDVITYRCDPGRQLNSDDTYRLTDGRTETTIVCQQNETWSQNVVSCERKFFFVDYFAFTFKQVYTYSY